MCALIRLGLFGILEMALFICDDGGLRLLRRQLCGGPRRGRGETGGLQVPHPCEARLSREGSVLPSFSLLPGHETLATHVSGGRAWGLRLRTRHPAVWCDTVAALCGGGSGPGVMVA